MYPIKHVIISAAGQGIRLGLNKPKCLIEIEGRTLLEWHMSRLEWAEEVWLVVGFQQESVIEHAKKIRPNVRIVINNEYDKTNTLQSIGLVSACLNERFMIIDADTVIDEESFLGFIESSRVYEQFIGVSRYITSDGVYVMLEGSSTVVGFSRSPVSSLEWTGIAVINPDVVVNESIYVYQAIERCLPLPAVELNAFDIDTVTDLEMARKVIALNWGNLKGLNR